MRIKFSIIFCISLFTFASFNAIAQPVGPPANGNYHSSLELQEMFLEGILLLAFFINLLFYRTTRDKAHLYFALMLLFLALQRSVTTVASYLHWSYPDIWNYLSFSIFSFAITVFFLVKFVSQFFHLKDESPFWHKFLLISALLFGAMTLVFQFIRNGFYSIPGFKGSLVWSGMLAVTCISILVVFFKFLSKERKYSRLIVIGGTPLMLVWGFYQFAAQYFIYNATSFRNFEKPPWWFLAERTTETVCIAWFTILFLWTLILRFELVKKENAQRLIDLERLETRKEIERRQLVDELNVTLEKTVEERTAELTESLRNLKATQAQLIQSEKMASLGELTAGIAHEIQNPLNFVNNFSDVNKELLSEMKDELAKGNLEEARAIASDVIGNEEKINHHGKRAEAIVKGMLQHSRSSNGQREPTNINTLADEYLRLAYHGLRAKDKSFNVVLQTQFDPTIGNIHVVPQDIGRVFLNLVTNAFYAVDEKLKRSKAMLLEAEVKYEPTVLIETKKINDNIEISITDNGNGIPSSIKDKIFQPFFTTKPSGQGTGLGLSLAYDIVKAHGGNLVINTMEGEGSNFIIQLPVA